VLVKLLLKSIKKTLTLDVNVSPVGQDAPIPRPRRFAETCRGYDRIDSRKAVEVWAGSQPWARRDEQIALLTRIATESGLRRVPTKADQ
jgi:hypothetical protein